MHVSATAISSVIEVRQILELQTLIGVGTNTSVITEKLYERDAMESVKVTLYSGICSPTRRVWFLMQ